MNFTYIIPNYVFFSDFFAIFSQFYDYFFNLLGFWFRFLLPEEYWLQLFYTLKYLTIFIFSNFTTEYTGTQWMLYLPVSTISNKRNGVFWTIKRSSASSILHTTNSRILQITKIAIQLTNLKTKIILMWDLKVFRRIVKTFSWLMYQSQYLVLSS